MMLFRLLHPRILYIVSLLISAVTLAAVLIMEYGFGLRPCELCTLQRAPFVAVLMIAGAALLFAKGYRRHMLCLALLTLAFFISTGLGIYHAGVEKNYFTGPTACTSGPQQAGMTVEELRRQIFSAPVVACNQPAWEWHGITLAGLNAAWSLLLFTVLAWGMIHHRKHRYE